MTSPKEHWSRVQTIARKVHADGCTGVPDLWFRVCCYEHDICYRTGRTFDGWAVSRWQADRRLRHCMYEASPLGRFSILAWVYWLGVRLLAKTAYKGEL